MVTSKPLSIAYVFDGNYTAGEGVPNYIKTLGDYYAENGHQVSYIVGESSSSDANVYSLGHTKSVAFNGNQIDIPLYAPNKQVSQALETVNPDILHVQMPYSPFVGARFVSMAKQEVGLIGTFHIVPESKLAVVGSRVLSFLNRASQTKFNSIVSVSASAQQFARSAYNLETEVVPCPIKLADYTDAKRLTEYDDNKLNVVFMGRLVERKGCRHLLAAVAALDKKLLAKIRVLVAGKGPLLEELQAQASSLGLEDTVSFVGFVSDELKPNFLASADVAVFPSTGGESFGIILLEAMASGARVVVGGDNDGYRDVLNNRPEFLVDPKNTAKFSKKLAELLLDPELRDSLHDYQQQLVRSYDINLIGPRLLAIYQAAI